MSIHRTPRFGFAAIGGMFLAASAAQAAVINVPADQPTIQAAINAAVSGADEVVVAPDTYNEVIDFLGKAITVRSSGGADVTIIHGAGLNKSVVRCVSGEGPGTVLQGFTITGGNPAANGGGMINNNSSPTVTDCTFSGNNAGASAGGMFNSNSNPTITNCIFQGNNATTAGGGMYNNNSNPTITGCIFQGNNATTGGGGGMVNNNSDPTVTDCTFTGNTTAIGGGGMDNFNGGDPAVTNCTFTGNMASGSGNGGGMRNLLSSDPTVTDCRFSGNTAAVSGGGMSNSGSTATVINCTFSENTTGSDGGGVANFGNSALTVTNCTFSENTAGSDGGGMFNNNSPPTVTNCTFSKNTAVGSGGGVYNTGNSNPAVDNCIFWSNSDTGGMDESAQFHVAGGTPTVDYSDLQGGWSGAGANNINVNPLFLDAVNEDLRLSALSPCIDAGDNDAVPAGTTTDLGGNPRFVDDPGTPDTGNPGVPGPPIVDMGAFEFFLDCNANGIHDPADLAAATSADCNNNGVPDECDIADGTSADCDANTVPDECQTDTEGDGVIDACDNCPAASNSNQTDSDADGVGDTCDGCPNDPAKTAAGLCGCGVSDIDADNNGIPDCNETPPPAPDCGAGTCGPGAGATLLGLLLGLAGIKVRVSTRRGIRRRCRA